MTWQEYKVWDSLFSIKLEGEDVSLGRIFQIDTVDICWIEFGYRENLNPIEQTNATSKNIYNFTIKSLLLPLPTIFCFLISYSAGGMRLDVEKLFDFIC
jgi:hypothetical protein